MKKLVNTHQEAPKNILIVDDNPIDGFIAESVLKNHFHTDWVKTGHEALEAINKKKYEVVLMDINLNDHTMNGITAMRKIKYQIKQKRTKIIAITARSDAREWYIKQGFDGHYLKPLIEKGILEEINNLKNFNFNAA